MVVGEVSTSLLIVLGNGGRWGEWIDGKTRTSVRDCMRVSEQVGEQAGERMTNERSNWLAACWLVGGESTRVVDQMYFLSEAAVESERRNLRVRAG